MKAVNKKIKNYNYHVVEFYFFVLDMFSNRRVVLSLFVVVLFFMPSVTNRNEFPTYRVVLDPGHGGVALHPMSVHGDRYETIFRRYLDYYKEGAARGALREPVIVYSIARKVEKILKLLTPGRNNTKFYQMLERYADGAPRKIYLITSLSRDRSISENEADIMDDPNANYRMFDYPDLDGRIRPGRISRINEGKPHLVVSLHLADAGPQDFEGMSPVITPPYRFLHEGLRYLQMKQKEKKFYTSSPYRDWFVEETTRSDFSWFLNDVSLYFTGYPLMKNKQTDRRNFKGYRYNMVTWSYADSPGWEHAARYHIPSSRYASSVKDFVPDGRFWDRERSMYEGFRRDGGEEGFGGDNAYASYEIIRYVCNSLNLHGNDYRTQKPGKSYISVWIMPLHVNAINAFIELGYLNRSRDRYLLTKKQDEIAEGIAVGIFSLLAGLEVKDKKFRYMPRGKAIDFRKYGISEDENYFNTVTGD